MPNPVLDPSIPFQLLNSKLPLGIQPYHLVTVGGILIVSALISIIFRIGVLKKYTRQNHGVPPKKAIKISKNISYLVFIFVFVILILPLQSLTFSLGKSLVGSARVGETKLTNTLKNSDKTGNYEQTNDPDSKADMGGLKG